MRIDVLYRSAPARDGDYAGRIVVWKPHPWDWTAADVAGGRAVATLEAGEGLMRELSAGRLRVESGSLVPSPEEFWPAAPGDEGVE